MSEEQLSALLAKLKKDTSLQEKLKGAAGLDAAVAMAQEAGFDVSKADWLRHQAKQTLELSDEELESVAGGIQAIESAFVGEGAFKTMTFDTLNHLLKGAFGF
jgi:predicted ribosomally synthesized peptide with nif11-like leader